MLKKLFKAALTACVVVGMSSTAMAWAPIGNTGLLAGFSTSASFGQYNTGVEDHSAYLTGKQETHFSFYGSKGKWKAWGDIEYDDNPQMDFDGSANKEIDTAVAYVSYNVSPQLSIRLGNIHHLAGLHYSNDGETIGYFAGHAGWNYAGYSEAPGLGVYYTISPEMNIQFTQYTTYAAAMTGQAEGSANALDFNGKMGGIMFHVGYLTEKKADHTDKDFESGSNTFTNLGVKVPIGDAMYVVVDYATAKLSWGTVDHEEPVTDIGLQFGMKGLGPGELIVTYATQTFGEATDGYSVSCSVALECATADTSLLYEIAAGPGKMQFYYASTASTPKDGDTTTSTWLATAFKVGF